MKKFYYVVNSGGEREPFSFRKIYRSAKRTGASNSLAKIIAEKIEREGYSGIKTSKIFERVKELLSKEDFRSSIKFSIKKAIQKLGPTGFPFEKFVGKIFEREGFEVKLNLFVRGFCSQYEIDFLAKKKDLIYIGECKFRHEPGGRVDREVALANYARFLDIQRGKFLNSGIKYKSIIVTNTKFTSEAIKYSECIGVSLLGWKYPRGRGLEFLIEKNQFYPITILPSVSQAVAKELIAQKIVLAKNILEKDFEKIKIKNKERILKEAEILLKK